MMTDVRVGIVTWNVEEHIGRCITSLPAALAGLDAEVVVVDNASSDASAEIAESAGATEVIRNERNVGYARAMNRALAADADVLVALNPDTVAPPGSLRRLVEELRSDPRVGLVAPLLVGREGDVEHSVHRFPHLRIAVVANLVPLAVLPRWLRQRLWLRGTVDASRSGPIDWAVGAVHVIRSGAIEPGPVYRERWFMYVEDLDLCWRLAAAGWDRRLVGSVAIEHVGNVSGRRAWGARRRSRWLHETYDWYHEIHGAGRTRAYAAVTLLGDLVRLAIAPLGPTGSPLRTYARSLRPALRTHARALVSGGAAPARAREADHA